MALHPWAIQAGSTVQGDPCPRRLGFVDLDLGCSTVLLGQHRSCSTAQRPVEHPKSKSTQPKSARRWVTLYTIQDSGLKTVKNGQEKTTVSTTTKLKSNLVNDSPLVGFLLVIDTHSRSSTFFCFSRQTSDSSYLIIPLNRVSSFLEHS